MLGELREGIGTVERATVGFRGELKVERTVVETRGRVRITANNYQDGDGFEGMVRCFLERWKLQGWTMDGFGDPARKGFKRETRNEEKVAYQLICGI